MDEGGRTKDWTQNGVTVSDERGGGTAGDALRRSDTRIDAGWTARSGGGVAAALPPAEQEHRLRLDHQHVQIRRQPALRQRRGAARASYATQRVSRQGAFSHERLAEFMNS